MGFKNRVFDHETRKSGLFPYYRLKINDFLNCYNQNLKIDIFTPLQQIPCYCKSRIGTLRLISCWRVILQYGHEYTPHPLPRLPRDGERGALSLGTFQARLQGSGVSRHHHPAQRAGCSKHTVRKTLIKAMVYAVRFMPLSPPRWPYSKVFTSRPAVVRCSPPDRLR